MSSDKNLLVDIWMISLLTLGVVDEMLAEAPLTADEFALYGLIVDLAPTAADLARGTGIPPTTLSGILNRCVRRGEVQKIPNPSDRRSYVLGLTDAGMELYATLVPKLQDSLAEIRAALQLPEAELRLALQELDRSLRQIRKIAPRPYQVAPGPEKRLKINYDGTLLTAAQQREVRSFITWVQHRDAEHRV